MKLKFYDYVKIKSGFYEGLKGNVTDINPNTEEYYVEGYYNAGFASIEFRKWIHKNILEKMEE